MALQSETLLLLEQERIAVEEEIIRLQGRLKEINDFVSHAKKLGINWAARAMDCLRGSYEPMTTDEILRCVFINDLEELNNTARRRNYILQLSLALNRLCTKGLVVGYNEDGYKGKFYYLKTREESPGKLKSEFKYYYEHKMTRIKAEKTRNSYE